MNQTREISINAKNLMPIIKKWLYSDRDIFLRELIANAVDAVTKHKKLARHGRDGVRPRALRGARDPSTAPTACSPFQTTALA